MRSLAVKLLSVGGFAGLLYYLMVLPTADVITPEMLAKHAETTIASSVTANARGSKNGSPRPATETPTLAIEKQRKIWDLEHSTFELEWKFGKLIKDALKNRNREQLVACFQDDFVGEIPVTENAGFTQGTAWDQMGISVIDDQTKEVNGQELADYLIDELSQLTKIQSIGLRVLKIDRIGAEASDGPSDYKITILITAKGIGEYGPASTASHHHLKVTFKDDDDIIGGKIVRRWQFDSLTARESDKPLFADVTIAAGLDKVDLPDNWKLEPLSQPDTYTSQIAVADFDQDGYLDIAVATIQGQQHLLRSIDGTSFEDVTEKVGLSKSRFRSLTTFSTWIDYDNDGYPDLLLGKNLYHNDQGKNFTRATTTAGLKFTSATMGAVVADYDCDGWLDLYVLNHFGKQDPDKPVSFVGDDTSSGTPNQLWRNLGNGKFENTTSQAGVAGEARHSFAASWMHANDDHFPDLYVVNDFGRNLFFINRGDGGFDEIADESGVCDYANSMGVASGDLDNDGTTEIYVANMFSKMGRRIIAHVDETDFNAEIYDGIRESCAGSHLYTPDFSDTKDLKYREISETKKVNAIGWAYAPVFADFDADGFLDIYATSGFISVDRAKPDG